MVEKKAIYDYSDIILLVAGVNQEKIPRSYSMYQNMYEKLFCHIQLNRFSRLENKTLNDYLK